MSSQPFSIPHKHVRMGAAHALAVEDEVWWALRSEPMQENEINLMGLSGLIGVGATLGIVHVVRGPVRGLVSVKCHNCVTVTKKRLNQNSGQCLFCQYQKT